MQHFSIKVNGVTVKSMSYKSSTRTMDNVYNALSKVQRLYERDTVIDLYDNNGKIDTVCGIADKVREFPSLYN